MKHRRVLSLCPGCKLPLGFAWVQIPDGTVGIVHDVFAEEHCPNCEKLAAEQRRKIDLERLPSKRKSNRKQGVKL